MKRFTTLALITLALVGVQPLIAAELSVAVVDMKVLLDGHPKTQANLEILRKQVEGFEAEQEAMLDEFSAKRDKYIEARKEAQDPVIGEAVRREREAALAGLREELQRMEQGMSETLLKRRRELEEQKLRMHKLVEDAVRDIVAAYARKQKLDFVVDRSAVGVSGSSVVVFAGEALDITAAVSRDIEGFKVD